MIGATCGVAGKPRVLDLGQLGISTRVGEKLIVLGLGSCVGLVMMTPDARAVGLAHIVLPDNPTPGEAENRPEAFFAAPAVKLMCEAFGRLGIPPAGLRVKLFGGGWTGPGKNALRIGKRNVMSVRRELWRVGLVPTAELVGKNVPLTVEVETGVTGVVVRPPGGEVIL